MPPREWLLRLSDILAALSRVADYTAGMDLAAFTADARTRDAVVWNFAVIGEAARLIPTEIEARFPDVPWASMRGMRNIVIHEYFGIDVEIVWETATRNLPPLGSMLREVIEVLGTDDLK
mgnify:CR=1 FL=1